MGSLTHLVNGNAEMSSSSNPPDMKQIPSKILARALRFIVVSPLRSNSNLPSQRLEEVALSILQVSHHPKIGENFMFCLFSFPPNFRCSFDLFPSSLPPSLPPSLLPSLFAIFLCAYLLLFFPSFFLPVCGAVCSV